MVEFDDSFRRQLRELFVWRRDVRRFRSDRLPDGAMDRLIETACLSPSVGLSQPWRFVIVDDAVRRRAVIDDFRACNADALSRYSGERAARYATLKLSGLEQAPGHLAVFADKTVDIGHGLGRATMPETTEYSVVAAITAMWLAARAEGIGLGWVSILNPDRMHAILDVPASWKFIAYLCIGYPEAECDRPELEQVKWEHRRGADEFTLRR
ncbi:5,6-dimethylbenzimidazole synthase [Bradyrhizobium sp. WBOS7]|uniref:5,6-dimethylbenzimidazole synthase n=1 Tax=Bradyrhizobium betae TaxID=244734 RepID=A0AAE9SUH0_9BRAD|nr:MULTISPECIES: 5,6-dimethylbenzimidazole synthase [Bradyrhizobium]MDD1571833.1 5,6-dimethylbenzimidazole synthase [Bradyrhizobium sp. WBOS1]UUO36232.1 5,6-dimethylbenzimidazole synthase [Bradyrhizobium sp. WBOS01]MDD1526697.1 5,6-dimethylbenzimidazole synthase [Bradyrhizobium sp. WBOS2]MDD1575337.1 5,6-dimethylbenzimidazole synthase [Bradyrhizobium sp. WBOS7]MDD1600800.1 5,6-dimethylbenzimidazole synthase [Bradyrhizobium sp. WBOS16]